MQCYYFVQLLFQHGFFRLISRHPAGHIRREVVRQEDTGGLGRKEKIRDMRTRFITALLSCTLLLTACQRGGTTTRTDANVAATPSATTGVENGTKGEDRMTLKLTSTAFEEGGVIPAEYT